MRASPDSATGSARRAGRRRRRARCAWSAADSVCRRRPVDRAGSPPARAAAAGAGTTRAPPRGGDLLAVVRLAVGAHDRERGREPDGEAGVEGRAVAARAGRGACGRRGSSSAPARGGVRVGSLPPSTCETGCEKVSRIGASGSACACGPGRGQHDRWPARGNQVTRTGAPRRLPRPRGRGDRERACRLLRRQRHRPARHVGARDGHAVDRRVELHLRVPAARDRHPAVRHVRGRRLDRQRLVPLVAERPALPSPGRRTDDGERDPLAGRDLPARRQPSVRDDERDRAAVVRPGAHADEAAGERLQLDAAERDASRWRALAPDIIQMPPATATATTTKAASAIQRPRCDRFLGGGLL